MKLLLLIVLICICLNYVHPQLLEQQLVLDHQKQQQMRQQQRDLEEQTQRRDTERLQNQIISGAGAIGR